MGDRSAIEWTDATWNPIRARHTTAGGTGHFCVHVSEGCRHCYAERLQPRFRNPARYVAQDLDQVELFVDPDTLTAPFRWRRPRMIFVCSMTDLFLQHHPDAFIDQVFAVMAATPRHTYQLLTKRPDRMCRYLLRVFDGDAGHEDWVLQAARITGDDTMVAAVEDADIPLPNVWVGVSAENQPTADARLPELRDTPAAVRFLSAEPLLGPIDLSRPPAGGGSPPDWVIVGGESGPGARPMHPAWARSVRDQCSSWNVPFFFKQWGEYVPTDGPPHPAWPLVGFGESAGPPCTMRRLGRKAAGRILDGREWNGMPTGPESVTSKAHRPAPAEGA